MVARVISSGMVEEELLESLVECCVRVSESHPTLHSLALDILSQLHLKPVSISSLFYPSCAYA